MQNFDKLIYEFCESRPSCQLLHQSGNSNAIFFVTSPKGHKDAQNNFLKFLLC